ncbi:MAG: choline dehydrogenase, partial [Mesorhizobium sp.]|uniref:GMC family oxidoreductase N-terminal domain-containing protein n=1 Tax=Mesorhizobium sp. TaxID=1871066 RepID=UPI000FE865FC
MLEADFVIIGAGSAGSAMAYRLSEDGKYSVIVIEFGGSDIGPLIQMPSALSIPLNMSLYDWGFADVLPYFKRMEDANGGENGWRGHGGPLTVQRGSRTNPLYGAFVEAGRQAGFELTDDYNGAKQEGFGPME